MALVIADRVRETSTTTGTGTLTLAGAVSGFQTFSTAIGNTNTCYYTIVNGSEWEVGLGTVAAGTLARTTVLKSSNAGSAVNFSAGTKDVFATYPADKAVDTDITQTLINKTLTSPTLTTPVLGTPTSGALTNCTADGTNSVGYRNIPNSGAKTSSYTLVAGDVGKFIELGTSGSVVVPASVFAAGDAISIFNNTSASISCTCSAVTTVYKGGTDADIASFSVTTRGVATILFITATVAVVTGNLA
jgi:hypothetical protein